MWYLFTCIISKFKVPGKGDHSPSKNGKFISVYSTVFIQKIDRIGISPPRQVVKVQHPVAMEQLPFLKIAFHIDGEVNPEIVRNSVTVPLGIINILHILLIINGDGVGSRSACDINKIGRYTESSVKFIIGNEIKVVGPVVI
jgi:hypothetical protein